MAVSHHFEKI